MDARFTTPGSPPRRAILQSVREMAASDTGQDLFWQLIDEIAEEDPRVGPGTIMGGDCARVGGEFLALVDFKGSGLVVKLPRERVDALIAEGVGAPFAPAGRVFREWVSVPAPDRERWMELLREGIAFVAPPPITT